MIYLYQNKEEYDYDVRAIALAFYEREKIIAVPEEEMDRLASEEQGEENVRFLSLIYEEGKISGRLFDREGKEAKQEVCCAYHDHEKSRNAVCRFLYRLFSEFTGRTLPWGMLTGIRPTKIVMKWMEETTDVQRESLEKRFSETYLADAQKAHLCVQVAEREKRFLESHPYEEEYSLYIGIPFCPTTCLYCSFASFPVERFGDRIAAYMQALTKEMEFVAQACAQKRLTSIYVGGGTPTALDEDSLQYLMEQIHRLFPVEKTREFTVEAGRPDSVTRKKLQILYDAGVGRISINPQTMHDETLRLIGRNHTVQQVRDAFSLAREVGFSNINMDMITGLPGEDISHVRGTLKEIFEMRPESLTVHSLAIKRAAHLNMEMEKYQELVKGSTNEMLRAVDAACTDMGMLPYYMYRQKNIPGNLENIGYSLPGKECLYNILIMEEKQDIISCGAGASTKYVFPEENRIERTENVKNIDHYINRIDEMIDRKRKYL
ncbi:MAG TPA: coproporphyrinogen dehydrogenase HemZ [Candidatus Anaerobutyricum avicola]|nr:coproporphyrinogen dehydrogenase HemZ [Candidatus Anaerobutyricum avicola]